LFVSIDFVFPPGSSLPFTVQPVKPAGLVFASEPMSLEMVSSSPLPPSQIPAVPAGLLGVGQDKVEHVVPICSHDILPAAAISGYSVSVAGNRYVLPSVSPNALVRADAFAHAYQHILFGDAGSALFPTASDLVNRLSRLRLFFAPAFAESEALSDVDNFQWPVGLFDRDRELLSSLGSFEAVVEYHAAIHRAAGINESRIREWLPDAPQLEKLVRIAEFGVEIDVDDDFVPFRRDSKFRTLQQRLLPVYRKHAFNLWNKNMGLLFRLSDLSPDVLAKLHTGNECHWTPKPDCAIGRFLIDCSNVGPDRVPLNGGTAKEKGIARYQKVVLPTLMQVILKWNAYRLEHKLGWWDMIMFKEDVTNCFNQIAFSTSSSKLLCAMVDYETVFVMITCGFGHTVTPMAWDMIGHGILNQVRLRVFCPTDMYVDDIFGAGKTNHVLPAREVVREITYGAVGPGAMNIKKAHLGPEEEILGFLIDFIHAIIRPKDKAIDKLFFLFFSFDAEVAQPLDFWQCLLSMVNLYSTCIRGMRPFVAAIQQMTHRCGKNAHKSKATPSALFAIEMWRAASVLLIHNRLSMSIPLDIFILSPSSQCDLELISDASPWRLAAGLYHPETKELLGWSTLLLPFAKGKENTFQTHREYLGHLFSLLLVLNFVRKTSFRDSSMITYRWINDNTGALAWAEKDKCSSLASQFACLAVSQLNLLSNIWLMGSVHLPGILMGDIDKMSRKEFHEDNGSDIRNVCPSLLPRLFVPLETIEIVRLFTACDPALQLTCPADYHANFICVHEYIRSIIDTL